MTGPSLVLFKFSWSGRVGGRGVGNEEKIMKGRIMGLFLEESKWSV